MSHNLSKSRYTQFRCCEKALWLNVFKPEMAIIDADTQDRFKVGIEVGDLAKNLLGDYQDMTTRLPDGRLDYARMIEKTKIAVSLGVENICEAAFSYEGNYCAVDLLHKIENGYQLYEVKSSTSPDKDIFAWDVAYQKFVLTGCGINVVEHISFASTMNMSGTAILTCINSSTLRTFPFRLKLNTPMSRTMCVERFISWKGMSRTLPSLLAAKNPTSARSASTV